MMLWAWIKGLFGKRKETNWAGVSSEVGRVMQPIENVAPVKLEPKDDISPWHSWLRRHLGQKEIPGPKHNKWIVWLFKFTSYKTNEDETPWCAACVNAALEETGFKGTYSAAAKSFIKFGIPCELKPGAVVVTSRAPGRFHVNVCDHVVDDKVYAGIGGNQGDELNVKVYPKSKIVAVRWPVVRK